MSFIADIFEKGGVLIYPLLLLLVAGIYVIVVKSIALRRKKVISPAIVEHIEQLLIAKKIPEAAAYCKQHAVPMTRVLLAGIVNYEKSESELKEILEEAGRQEVPQIRSYLATLGTIASVAPLLGLFGTVLGMISVFATLSESTTVNPAQLAGGISEALITTACGMLIAMPTLAYYNFFIARVQNLIIEMEKISLRMVAVLKRA